MSDKRFKLAYEKGNEAIFEDLANPYPRRMTNKEVEKLLNEQAETIRKQSIRIYCQDKEVQRLLGELEKIPKNIREVWLE